ncbi:MAG TPA: MnhB domain-containing protein [Acidimicrobiales bacterium]|nr:MnhB domain-containing protein [Acidimicrobiales bacterium]
MSRQSLILDVGTRAVFHTILLFSVFLLLSGHNAPGGGFVGGLVAGAALVLRDVAADFSLARSRFRSEDILSVGLLIAVATGAAGLVRGGHFLEMDKFTVDLPLFGQVKATSALAFDIGVFFIVVGVILTIVEKLGEELEQ